MSKQLRMSGYAYSQLLLLALAGALLLLLVSTSWVWSMPAAVDVVNWNTTTALPEGVALRNVVTHGDFLYTVGGKGSNENPLDAIRGAPINPDGSLGAWNLMGQLPMPLYLHTAVVVDDALYVMGGWDGGRTRREVWRGRFNTDGSVGNWQAMPDYPLALDLHDSVYLNGRIYVVGGWDSEQAQTAVYQAQVNATGLSGWQLAGNLPVPLYRLAVTGLNGTLYVTGGFNSSAMNTVYVAGLNADGSLLPWASGPALPNTLYYHKALIHDRRLTVIGGRNDSVVFDGVYFAALGSNGLPGAWQSAPSLPAAIYRFGAATVQRNGSDYIYVVGGLRSESDYQRAVYHSNVPNIPTATPTPTPTITPTPTPTPILALGLHLANQPVGWVAPAGEVTYRITYANRNPVTFTDVIVNDLVPAGVELVPDSIQTDRGAFSASGSQAGATITWELGDLTAGATGVLAYRVRRPVPPTPVVPLALEVAINAPATVEPGEEITYTLVVTNRSPVVINNLVLTNTMPIGSTYVRGADAMPNARLVQWNLGDLAANSTAEVSYTVQANESLVNYDYRVSSTLGPGARGRTLAITLVNNQPPRHGDPFALVNDGVTANWGLQGQSNATQSNGVANPSYWLYLPNIQR